MTFADISLLLPEIVLIAAAAAIYLFGAFFSSSTQRLWRWLAGGALLLAAAALWFQSSGDTDGMCLCDVFARYVRWFALAAGALLLTTAARPLRFDDAPEYVGSLLLAVAGLMLVGAADDIVFMFVALELISIPTYILLYLGRDDAESQESAAKYFFLGILSSAILLYGLSFLYGMSGSTTLPDIMAAASGGPFARMAMALIFAGLCFKVAAVPFHFYAPDVYQGATYPNAALLSVLPKAAGFVAMTRIIVMSMPGQGTYGWAIVLAVALLTMTFGNVTALWQNDFRRLLAYSSVAQSGYVLLAMAVSLAMPVSSAGWDGVGAMWFYLVAYAAATIGAFAVMEYLDGDDRDRRSGTVDALAGLGGARPATAAAMAVCMFSLAGVPPLAGFWGKLLVFGGALNVESPLAQRWFIAAAVGGALNAAVAAAYYLRVVAVMYFKRPSAPASASIATVSSTRGGRGARLAAMLCALLVVAVGVYPGPLIGAGEFIGQESSRDGATLENATMPIGVLKKGPSPQPAPQYWSDGDEQSSCPNGLSHLRDAAIIAVDCDNKLSYHILQNRYMRKSLPG